jgi:nicotinamidase-related amidase
MTTTPPRRALIVIDVQNEYVTGDLPIEYPDVRLSLRNIGRAIDAAHAQRIPVVVVQNTAPPGAPIFVKDSHGWGLHDVVTSRARDHYVEKRLPSAFAGTDLEAWLRERRIDTLTVIGYMTQNCVDSTVKQALHLGFAVECLCDATGSVSYANQVGFVSAEVMHQTVHIVLQSRFASVLRTEEWQGLLESGAKAEGSTIYASNQLARMEFSGTLSAAK